jgi:hypothetical protein
MDARTFCQDPDLEVSPFVQVTTADGTESQIDLGESAESVCKELWRMYGIGLEYSVFLDFLDIVSISKGTRQPREVHVQLFWPTDDVSVIYQRLNSSFVRETRQEQLDAFNEFVRVRLPDAKFVRKLQKAKALELEYVLARRTKRPNAGPEPTRAVSLASSSSSFSTSSSSSAHRSALPRSPAEEKVSEHPRGGPVIMKPVERPAGNFEWPKLEVRFVSDAVGDGVYAKQDIPAGTFVPILGERVRSTYLFDVGDVNVNADPEIRPGRGTSARVGFCGLAIVGKMNEPPPGTRANAELVRNYLRIARNIAKGEELTVHYGSSYARDYEVGRRASTPLTTRFPEDLEEVWHSWMRKTCAS